MPPSKQYLAGSGTCQNCGEALQTHDPLLRCARRPMLPKWCACADKRHCVHGYCGYCGGRTYGGRHFDDDTPSGFLNCGREADLCHSDGLDQCPLVTCGVPYSAHAPTAARVHRELCLGFVA